MLWKSEVNPLREVPELARLQQFDWTSCLPALETWERIHNHLLRHGSVSPTWVSEAQAHDAECQERMRAAAAAIAEILLRRRLEYARWI